MLDKLPETAVKRIDEALAVHQRAWNNLKRKRHRLRSTREMDRAFYDYLKVWLSVDSLIDDQLKAHTLTYWKDPTLKPVLSRCGKLQLALVRLPAQVKKKAQALVCRELDKLIQTLG